MALENLPPLALQVAHDSVIVQALYERGGAPFHSGSPSLRTCIATLGVVAVSELGTHVAAANSGPIGTSGLLSGEEMHRSGIDAGSTPSLPPNFAD